MEYADVLLMFQADEGHRLPGRPPTKATGGGDGQKKKSTNSTLAVEKLYEVWRSSIRPLARLFRV